MVRRQIESVSKKHMPDADKDKIKALIDELVAELIETGGVNEDVYLKLIRLSPRKDDSALLNKLVSDVEVWASYNEDFDEKVDFPTTQYYEELIKFR